MVMQTISPAAAASLPVVRPDANPTSPTLEADKRVAEAASERIETERFQAEREDDQQASSNPAPDGNRGNTIDLIV